jgi:hypothetical protein
VALPGNEKRACHEKKFSPRLSIAAADSRRKSAKRRRSGLSCRANQILKEFSHRPPIFSGKLIPGGFGGKTEPDRA